MASSASSRQGSRGGSGAAAPARDDGGLFDPKLTVMPAAELMEHLSRHRNSQQAFVAVGRVLADRERRLADAEARFRAANEILCERRRGGRGPPRRDPPYRGHGAQGQRRRVRAPAVVGFRRLWIPLQCLWIPLPAAASEQDFEHGHHGSGKRKDAGASSSGAAGRSSTTTTNLEVTPQEGGHDDNKVIRPTTMILRHMFTPAELRADDEILPELEADVSDECFKFGPVDNVKICGNHPQGVIGDIQKPERCCQMHRKDEWKM
ncbi:hypothetical protein EJB05_12724, partial [Eragrostis curvula]